MALEMLATSSDVRSSWSFSFVGKFLFDTLQFRLKSRDFLVTWLNFSGHVGGLLFRILGYYCAVILIVFMVFARNFVCLVTFYVCVICVWVISQPRKLFWNPTNIDLPIWSDYFFQSTASLPPFNIQRIGVSNCSGSLCNGICVGLYLLKPLSKPSTLSYLNTVLKSITMLIFL